MNNTNSFIMRDQVGDVVRSLMQDHQDYRLYRYLRQASLIAIPILLIAF